MTGFGGNGVAGTPGRLGEHVPAALSQAWHSLVAGNTLLLKLLGGQRGSGLIFFS